VSETGSVKFSYQQVRVPVADFAGFQELNACRCKLLQLRLVGVGSDGISFGNLSVRDHERSGFFITGSGTGGVAHLEPEHCAKVIAYDFGRNWLRSQGVTIASSESLTHAAIYEADESASSVIHCHNAHMWERLREVVPTTSAEVEYGTPQMAQEVKRLFATTAVKETKLFVMAGHANGVIAFGTSFEEALGILTC